MGYPTESTIWPRPEPSAEVKQLVDLFFQLADSSKDDAGPRMAEEVFSSEGKFTARNGSFKGTSEIRTCRKDAWTQIQARHHTVLKVYVNDADGTDLLVIGHVDATSKEGVVSGGQFVARMNIEEAASSPKMREYRVIHVSSPDSEPFM